MVRLCFLILTNAALLMSRMRPEPPETNFFLTSIPLITGLQRSVVFFTNSYSTRPEPLCLKNDDYRSASANLLAHKLCTEAKFSTFLQASLVSSDSALGYSSEISTYSELSCHQDDYYDIVCNRSSSSNSGSCSLLQVTCGACHKHVSLQPNSSLQLMSPLYPVLQPGQVCQYDLQLAQGVSADITLEITDLSLAPAKPSHSGVHCVASFLHILSGQSFFELESLATLCGEVYYPGGTSYYRVTDSVVRLMLVSGADDGALGRRGFLLNIHVSSSRVKIPLQRLLIFLSFFGFLIIVCVLMSSVLIYLNRKSKARVAQPRRRQTWHGSLARPGESLHQVRTERIRQLGSSWSRNSWGSNNLYTFDNRVSRRLPQLPAFNFTSEDIIHRMEDEDPGFKVYETISLQSRSPDRVLDEAIANTEKKFLVNSLQCPPPPLPTRPSLLAENPYSSPLYLTLPGCYSEVVDSRDTMTRPDITVGEDTSAEEPSAESCSHPEETCHPASRSKAAENGFSVLIERIRSISMTKCIEDETNLIARGDIEGGEGGDVF